MFETKAKFQQLFENGKTVNLLKDDPQMRIRSLLRSLNLQLYEKKATLITDIAERHVTLMILNISERFSSDVSEVLDSFSIFDSEKFLLIAHAMSLLCTAIFLNIVLVLGMNKFELISMRKKMVLAKGKSATR